MNARSENGVTPLDNAAGAGHAQVVRLLLNSGGHINAKEQGGFTPLMVSAAEVHDKVVIS